MSRPVIYLEDMSVEELESFTATMLHKNYWDNDDGVRYRRAMQLLSSQKKEK